MCSEIPESIDLPDRNNDKNAATVASDGLRGESETPSHSTQQHGPS